MITKLMRILMRVRRANKTSYNLLSTNMNEMNNRMIRTDNQISLLVI